MSGLFWCSYRWFYSKTEIELSLYLMFRAISRRRAFIAQPYGPESFRLVDIYPKPLSKIQRRLGGICAYYIGEYVTYCPR